jgi:hypothetical protein
MNDSEEVKRDALGRIYSTVVNEMTEFRTTIAKILFGSAGAALLVVGWAVTTAPVLSLEKRIIFTIAILLFVVYSSYVTRKMERYFLDIAQVINRIDRIHLAFDVGAYHPEEALLPDHWRQFGHPSWKEPIFRAAYIGIAGIGLFGTVTVWVL